MIAKRYVFFGPYSWRFGFLPQCGDSFAVCQIEDGPADVNTILLSDGSLTGNPFWHVRTDGAVLTQGRHSGCTLTNLRVSEELVRLMPGEEPAPLLVVTDSREATRFFAQVRTGERDILAVWCGEWTEGDRPTDRGQRLSQILVRGLSHAEAHRQFLNNYQLYFWKYKAGTEIEHKLTIDPAADIYRLSVHFRNLVGQGPLSGYIWEYRDDFEQWDFDNHLYEVVGPPEEAGYISLMPDSRGTTAVKRKWFTADAVERRESKWTGIELGGLGADYIRRRFGVEGRYLGMFRRTRFDISLESLATGNICALMIDRCRFDRDGWPDLCQVEVEYLRTRSVRSSASGALAAEMRQILDVVKEQLGRLGVRYQESPLSKLTYMKELHDGVVR